MIVVIKEIDKEHDSIRWIREAFEQRNLTRSSSRLLELFPNLEYEDLNHAIKKAVKVFHMKGFNTREHFQQIYSSAGKGVSVEWKLSIPAYHLVVHYCDSDHSLLVKF